MDHSDPVILAAESLMPLSLLSLENKCQIPEGSAPLPLTVPGRVPSGSRAPVSALRDGFNIIGTVTEVGSEGPGGGGTRGSEEDSLSNPSDALAWWNLGAEPTEPPEWDCKQGLRGRSVGRWCL